MQEHRNDQIVVRFDPKLCVHSAQCVKGLPAVFDVTRKPWINVDGASVESIRRQVEACPSRALSYELPSGEA